MGKLAVRNKALMFECHVLYAIHNQAIERQLVSVSNQLKEGEKGENAGVQTWTVGSHLH